MNNEPVAWMHYCLKSGIGYLSFTKPPPLDDYKPIPLYTHLAKELTLLDEEMYELLEKYQGIELCKAVLKKASEK